MTTTTTTEFRQRLARFLVATAEHLEDFLTLAAYEQID